jgi:hypothetical protein
MDNTYPEPGTCQIRVGPTQRIDPRIYSEIKVRFECLVEAA